MSKKEVIKLARAYSKLVSSNIKNVEYIVLFGSYSKGNARQHSDIDIAVITRNIKTDILETSAELFRLAHQINSKIEPILIDEKKDPAGFLDEIIKTGTIIYKKAA